MKVPLNSLISARALHLFKRAAVVIEHHLVRLNQRPRPVKDNHVLRQEIDQLPELPIRLLERRLRSIALDGDSSNPAGIIDQLYFVRLRISNFAIIDAKSSQYV